MVLPTLRQRQHREFDKRNIKQRKLKPVEWRRNKVRRDRTLDHWRALSVRDARGCLGTARYSRMRLGIGSPLLGLMLRGAFGVMTGRVPLIEDILFSSADVNVPFYF